MGLEALKVSEKSTYCCQAPVWVCAPVGSADASPASPCPSFAAPRTCSPLLPTPQFLPGTQDFVFVDLFASSPAGSEGRREAVQPGASGLRAAQGSGFQAAASLRTKARLATGRQLGDRSGVFLEAGRGPRPPSPFSSFRESLRTANGVGLNKPTETGEEPPPSPGSRGLVTRPRPSQAETCRSSRKGWGHGPVWGWLDLGGLTFAPFPGGGGGRPGVLPPAGGEQEARGARRGPEAPGGETEASSLRRGQFAGVQAHSLPWAPHSHRMVRSFQL